MILNENVLNCNIRPRAYDQFSKLYEKLTDEEFIDTHRLESSAFKRDRIFSFRTLVTYQLQRSSRSLNGELLSLFVDCLEAPVPSKSAYSKARKKLSHTCYDSLNMELLSGLPDGASWNGHRVRSIDGSTVQLPRSKECVKEYGSYDMGRPGSTKEACMGRTSIFYDVLNKVVLDSTLDHYRCSEKEQFGKFVHLIGQGDVLLMDNYYAKHGVLGPILDARAHFVVPLTEKLHVVRRFLKHKKKAEQLTKITFTDSGTKEHLTIEGRLIKKKVKGAYKVLFTSIPQGKGRSRAAIFALYAKRWGVETCYGHLKNTLEMADWSGTSVLAVRQDFKSKILLHNITALLCRRIRPKRKKSDQRNRDTQRKRIISFSNALCRCKSLIRGLLKGKELDGLITDFIANVKSTIEYSRKGQAYPRSYFEGRKYHMNQKHA